MTCSTLGCKDGKILGLFEFYDCPECSESIGKTVRSEANRAYQDRKNQNFAEAYGGKMISESTPKLHSYQRQLYEDAMGVTTFDPEALPMLGVKAESYQSFKLAFERLIHRFEEFRTFRSTYFGEPHGQTGIRPTGTQTRPEET